MSLSETITTIVQRRKEQRAAERAMDQKKRASLAEVSAFMGKDMDLAATNRLVYGGPWDMNAEADVLVVLGCLDCEYRVRKAFEIGRRNPQTLYIVSGGVPCIEEDRTEAEFMAGFLRGKGVSDRRILIENRARDTRDNMVFSDLMLKEYTAEHGISDYRVGIVTGHFHIVRSKKLIESLGSFQGHQVVYFPAYDHETSPEHWFDNPTGRKIILNELRLIRNIK